MNTKTLQNKVEEILKDQHEAQIFVFLLLNPHKSVKEISDATSINRSSLYRYIDSLIKKGLVSKSIEQYGTSYNVASPDVISKYLDDKGDDLDRSKQLANEIISGLDKVKISNPDKTRVNYYEGIEGYKQIVWNSLKATGTTYAYTVFKRHEVFDKEFFKRLSNELKGRSLVEKIITNKEGLKNLKNRKLTNPLSPIFENSIKEVKIALGEDLAIQDETFIYDNTFVMISINQSHITGVEIIGETFVDNQKAIFEKLWEFSEAVRQ